MRGPKFPINLEQEELETLQKITRKHSEKSSIVLRAKMILISNSKCEIESLSKKALDKSIRCLYNAMGKYNWNSRGYELSLSIRTTTCGFQSTC